MSPHTDERREKKETRKEKLENQTKKSSVWKLSGRENRENGGREVNKIQENSENWGIWASQLKGPTKYRDQWIIVTYAKAKVGAGGGKSKLQNRNEVTYKDP